QKRFRKITFWILVLGLIAVFLVVVQKQGLEIVRRQQVKGLTEHPPSAESTKPYQRLENALGWLRYPIIVIPILVSILLAYYKKNRPAKKWILLRGSAEAIKREIYRYRCCAGDYSKDRFTTNSRDDAFYERLA